MNWKKLTLPSPLELAPARTQLHWAAQVIAAVGNTLVEAQSDESHTNMGWDDAHDALLSHPFADERRIGIIPASMELVILRGTLVSTRLEVRKQTLGELMQWAVENVGATGPLKRPSYEMPAHPIDDGEAFAVDTLEPYAELGRWFSNSATLIAALIEGESRASEIRCWPHHFDIATLIAYDPDAPDPETARSIGIGMTPGDAGIPEPYFYVGPWPRPSERAPLDGGGVWNDDGWAYVRGSNIAGAEPSDAEHQEATARDFLTSAYLGSRNALGV